jgi:hypothetical protein
MAHENFRIVELKARGRWRLVYWRGGKRFRPSFPTLAAAKATRKQLTSGSAPDEQFALLSAADRERLMQVWREADRRQVDLLAALTRAETAATTSPPAGDVLAEMFAAKRSAGRDHDYLKSLRQVVKMFLRGRERRAVNLFTLADVEGFLAGKNPASRATLRSRLSTYFKFAVRRKHRLDNPCAALEHVKVLKSPPQIFTPEQAEACLKWFLKLEEGGRRKEQN